MLMLFGVHSSYEWNELYSSGVGEKLQFHMEMATMTKNFILTSVEHNNIHFELVQFPF